MSESFKITIPDYVCAVMAEINKFSLFPDEDYLRGKSYVVGGCVRDALLGRTPNDWDVTTNLPAEEILNIFSALPGFDAYPTGIEHGTVTVVRDNLPVEVTTFRFDVGYVNHRHPTAVLFLDSIDRDLERRDFTINAMAYSPESGIIDLNGGAHDLENGIIRCVGKPEERFDEDALRIIRALRFASVLDFEIEKDTAKAALDLRGLLTFISRERITSELEKLLCGKAAARVLRDFHLIIEDIFPALAGDSVIRAAEYVSKLGDAAYPLKLAALLSDIEPHRIQGAFMNLRLDNKTRRHAENILLHLHTELGDNAALKRLCRDIGSDAARDVIRLGIARSERDDSLLRTLSDICTSGECFTTAELRISGKELLSMGAIPHEIGKILDTLLERVIKNELPNDQTALQGAADTLINRKETT
ncbi:MAG: hypothetical protein IJ428_02240 [Clostridia bacterium]|nr:hypothetical protein [Clostridia bacterium]